jgi:hypothetical protein
MLENERSMEEAERQLKHQHRVYCSGRSPVRGARELKPIAIHRLGLDVGSSGNVLGRSQRDTVAGQPRKISHS